MQAIHRNYDPCNLWAAVAHVFGTGKLDRPEGVPCGSKPWLAAMAAAAERKARALADATDRFQVFTRESCEKFARKWRKELSEL